MSPDATKVRGVLTVLEYLFSWRKSLLCSVPLVLVQQQPHRIIRDHSCNLLITYSVISPIALIVYFVTLMVLDVFNMTVSAQTETMEITFRWRRWGRRR